MPSDELARLLAAYQSQQAQQQPAAPAAAPQPNGDAMAAMQAQIAQLTTLVGTLASAATQRPAPTVQPNAYPVSDKGSPNHPGSGASVHWRAALAANPAKMDAASRRAMDVELGREAARRMRVAAVQEVADEIRVRPDRTETFDANNGRTLK